MAIPICECGPLITFPKAWDRLWKQPYLPFCACGCGQRVSKLGNKYIKGHYWKNRKPK